VTRPTVLVYHADPTYAALVRAPRGRVVVRRAATPSEAERLATEARVRWAAVRRGDYPWWCAAFAARPALALVLPGPLRRVLRRARLRRNERGSER